MAVVLFAVSLASAFAEQAGGCERAPAECGARAFLTEDTESEAIYALPRSISPIPTDKLRERRSKFRVSPACFDSGATAPECAPAEVANLFYKPALPDAYRDLGRLPQSPRETRAAARAPSFCNLLI